MILFIRQLSVHTSRIERPEAWMQFNWWYASEHKHAEILVRRRRFYEIVRMMSFVLPVGRWFEFNVKGAGIMATYRSWLAEQEKREDMTGWYARYWTSITPGRISAPQGIERVITEKIAELEEAGRQGDNVENFDEKLSHARYALEAHPRVVEEYHKRDAVSTEGEPDPGQPVVNNSLTIVADPAQPPGYQDAPASLSVTSAISPENASVALGPSGQELPHGAQSAPNSQGLWQAIPTGPVSAYLAPPLSPEQQQEAAQRYIQATYAPDPGSWTTVRGPQDWPARFWRMEAKIDHLTELVTQMLDQLGMHEQAATPTALLAAVAGELGSVGTVLDAMGESDWVRMIAAHPEAASDVPWAVLGVLASRAGEASE